MSFASAFRLLLMAGLIAGAIVGLVGLVLPSAALVSVPGVVLGALAALTFGRVWPSLVALAVLAMLTVVALLSYGEPWLAAVIMGLVGVGLGLSTRAGLHGIALNIAIFGASAFFAVDAPVGQVGSMAAALSTAMAIVAGGALAILAFLLVARGKTLPPTPVFSWSDTVVHTVTLAVTLSVATAILLTSDRTPVAAWLLVTIIVLSQPVDRVTVRRSAERVVGTLAGAALAGLVILVVTAEWLLIAVALVCLVFAWSYRLSHPPVEQGRGYWVYALIWTPAMVVLAVPQGGSATLDADYARGIFTVIAAIAVVAVTFVVRRVVLLRSTATK
ncbi:MAG: FUSC family protein [Actinobacteria bacterium]|nr:FUSC family protein [Actinomycetota bacterium]